MGTFISYAMNPIMPKMTKPAKKDVKQLHSGTTMESLQEMTPYVMLVFVCKDSFPE